MDQVKIDSRQAAESKAALETIERSISGVSRIAVEASERLDRVKLGPVQAAETRASVDSQINALERLSLPS